MILSWESTLLPFFSTLVLLKSQQRKTEGDLEKNESCCWRQLPFSAPQISNVAWTLYWGQQPYIYGESDFKKNESMSPFSWDREMNSSHFPLKPRPLIGWPAGSTNQRPRFWWEMAGNHFPISDKRWLQL